MPPSTEHSPVRVPVVAGRFYEGDAARLRRDVEALLARAGGRPEREPSAPDRLVMLPHAGYVYSGGVAGRTVGEAAIAPLALLLGPNHTGRGAPLALWPGGAWEIPGASLPVDAPLVQALLDAEPRLVPDAAAHLGEHSLEVLLPFLARKRPDLRIAALAVAEPDLGTLLAVAESLAGVLAGWPEPVSLVVSSDMSHYISQTAAADRDGQAIERILAGDPEGLHRVVREKRISMCGVLPMTLGLAMARRLGMGRPRLVEYATSGDATGDFDKVVGYAGVIVPAQPAPAVAD